MAAPRLIAQDASSSAAALIGGAGGLIGVRHWRRRRGSGTIAKQHWSFAGPFGTFDQEPAAARLPGVQGSLLELPLGASADVPQSARKTAARHFSDAQVKALAATYTIADPDAPWRQAPRPAVGSLAGAVRDREDARDANGGGVVPPDMSVLAKARGIEDKFPNWVFNYFTTYAEGGPDYIHALLNGYRRRPAAGTAFKLPDGKYYNELLPGPCDRHAAAADRRAGAVCGGRRRRAPCR